MSSLALVSPEGELSGLEPALKPVRDRIRQARDYRRRYFEPNWQLNLAYAQGNHWAQWNKETRTLRTIQEVDPRYKGRELVTADVLTEYRMTALGELGSDNDRPGLLLRRDDVVSEDYQEQLNRALAYGWDHEFDADDALAQVDRYTVDLGTAAMQCVYDNTKGPVAADNIPHLNGRPVLDVEQATQLLGNGPNPNVEMLPVKAGRICWRPLSAFQLLAPPGASHEQTFTWEGTVSPAYLPDVQEMYPLAASLKEDADISTGLGISTSSPTLSGPTYSATDAKANRLRDHIWLFSYYERPSQKYPQGREITFASNELKLLDYKERLPYEAPNGEARAGLTYFHWWRVTGRFWSRGLVDVLRDGQRGINKRRTQINEIIDRNMPYVIVQKDSLMKRRVGLVNELVEIVPGEREPQPITGIGPGPWMAGDVQMLREDLQHASGISGPRRGENPVNVTTYSQLALINELDTGKREPIYLERKRSIARLVEDTIYDIRAYKGPEWEIALGGDNDTLEAATFNATKIPPFFIVEIGKGSAKPRSQAAELQKITDIWNGALQSTAAQQNPGAWMHWFKDSIAAGEPLDLPTEGVEDPGEKAEYENHYMQQGVPMPIAYYDVHALHLPRHRQAQDHALFSQDMATWQTIEQHCKLHINAAVAQAQAQMQQQQQLPPAGSPPSGGSSPSPPR